MPRMNYPSSYLSSNYSYNVYTTCSCGWKDYEVEIDNCQTCGALMCEDCYVECSDCGLLVCSSCSQSSSLCSSCYQDQDQVEGLYISIDGKDDMPIKNKAEMLELMSVFNLYKHDLYIKIDGKKYRYKYQTTVLQHDKLHTYLRFEREFDEGFFTLNGKEVRI